MCKGEPQGPHSLPPSHPSFQGPNSSGGWPCQSTLQEMFSRAGVILKETQIPSAFGFPGCLWSIVCAGLCISHMEPLQKAHPSLNCLFSPCSSSPRVSSELVVNGELVCSRLSLSEPSAVSMPNPDMTSNWAPQIRKAGTLLWCCKQVGQAEPLPLAVCCRVQKERDRMAGRTREKETRGIWTDPSWCIQNNLSFTLKLA